jgi:hypothetical protein
VAEDGTAATDTLSKAMHRKAVINLDSTGTEMSFKSFLSFLNNRISLKLARVGVLLGSTVKDIDVSAKALRHMKFDRLKVAPKVSVRPDITVQDEDELSATIDCQILSHLVGEVSKVVLDEVMLSSFYDLQASFRKSKSNSASKKFKSSRKLKSSKSTIVSQ